MRADTLIIADLKALLTSLRTTRCVPRSDWKLCAASALAYPETGASRLPMRGRLSYQRVQGDVILATCGGRLRSSGMAEAIITVMNPGDLEGEVVYGVIYPPQVALAGFGTIIEQRRDGNQPDKLPRTACAQPRHFVTA